MRMKLNPWGVSALVLGVAAVAVPALAQAQAIEASQPQLLVSSQIAAQYPPAALAVRFSGTVTVAAHVARDGSVAEVEVLDSTHRNVGFEDAAIGAVQQWEFVPAAVDGTPVDSVAIYRINFEVPHGAGTGDYPVASSDFMIGGLVPPGMSSRETSRLIGGGFQPTEDRRGLRLVKPRLPPSCLGCIYDKRDLLPPQSRGFGNTPSAK
jgi:TonB family protein